MEPKFKISTVFRTSWHATFSQIWVLVGLLIGYTILSLVLGIFSMPTQGSTAGTIIVQIINIVIGCIFTLGYLKNMFQTLDGDEPQFSAYGQQCKNILKYLVASIIYSIIIVVGLGLLIIPGIYLGLRLQFYQAFIVEENSGIIESLKKSWEITRGQTLQLFWLSLTMIGLMILGIIVFVVGIFVTIPLISMMYCNTFRKLNTLEIPATSPEA